MYFPKHFSASREQAVQIMREFPFAAVISVDENGFPFVNHLPILTEVKDGRINLVGHMSKRNPQWMHFKTQQLTIVFTGPHGYVSPTWYVSGRDVPTWNYAVVHVTGPIRLIEGFEGLCEIIEKLSNRFESGRTNPWKFDLPDDLRDPRALTSAIVGFELEAHKIEAKFKLSQNRTAADQQGVLDGLEGERDEMSRKLSELMKPPKTQR